MHRIQTVEAKDNFIIEAVFFNGQVVQYDVKQLFHVFPQFQAFEKERKLFSDVKVDEGGYAIFWNDELDLDADTIWEDGLIIEKVTKGDAKHLLAYQLLLAREKVGMTQKELAKKTGIYQADISKLERGIGNPSLATLQRLATGLGMELSIDFVAKKEE